MPKAFRTTVTGSYPRPVQPADTLKKPTLDRQQADEIIRWAWTRGGIIINEEVVQHLQWPSL